MKVDLDNGPCALKKKKKKKKRLCKKRIADRCPTNELDMLSPSIKRVWMALGWKVAIK